MDRRQVAGMYEQMRIFAGGVDLPGDLELPDGARGVIVFAHGSGSSRLSPRNRYVAAALRQSGAFGTLLFDLLTPAEDDVYSNRFDIGLLAERLSAATAALRAKPDCVDMRIGYFGASTGAAAAIVAAVRRPGVVDAVVSRGGRPDLAGDLLEELHAPTLLIVGGLDYRVIDLNEQAFRRIPARDKLLEIVPGATHLFEEPGTLERVAALASEWFGAFLAPHAAR